MTWIVFTGIEVRFQRSISSNENAELVYSDQSHLEITNFNTPYAGGWRARRTRF